MRLEQLPAMDDISWESYHISGGTFCSPQHQLSHQWEDPMDQFPLGISEFTKELILPSSAISPTKTLSDFTVIFWEDQD